MIMETPTMHDTDLAMFEDDVLIKMEAGPDEEEDFFDDDQEDFELDELDSIEEFDDDFDDDDY